MNALVRIVCATCLALIAAGCEKQQASTVTPLDSDTISDPSGEARVEIAYQPKGSDEIEIIVKLNALGTEEMDKVVVDVAMDGFHVADGASQWQGFIPPRQPQTYRVVLGLLHESTGGTVRVSVSRSHDSFLLMHRELTFEKTDGGLRPTG